MRKTKKTLKSLAPEDALVNKLRAFFISDFGTVKVSEYDRRTRSITIQVSNPCELVAMKKYLVKKIRAGRIVVNLKVLASDAYVASEAGLVELEDFETEMDSLFYSVLGYDCVKRFKNASFPWYVLFQDDVLLQYQTDDISDPYGITTEVPAVFAGKLFNLGTECGIATRYFG